MPLLCLLYTDLCTFVVSVAFVSYFLAFIALAGNHALVSV